MIGSNGYRGVDNVSGEHHVGALGKSPLLVYLCRQTFNRTALSAENVERIAYR